MNYWLLLIPFLSAFTGWFIIRVIIYRLFYPLQPKSILGIRMHGIYPSRKSSIAQWAGSEAAASFAGLQQILENKIKDPSGFQAIKPLIETHIDEFLRHKLKEKMPMVGMLIGDKTISTMKEVFMEEIELLFPRVLDQLAGRLQSDIDIAGLVSSKIEAIPSEEIARKFYSNAKSGIRRLYAFAIITGLLIGLIQLLVVLFLIR